MTRQSDDLPVLVTDGTRSSGPGGFTREFSRLPGNPTWRETLMPAATCSQGASPSVGTPQNGWVLRWLNPELPRSALGYEAATQRLERLLLTCHPPNRPDIENRIRRARRGQGPALPGEIAGIIREHGPGGNEPEDGIALELAQSAVRSRSYQPAFQDRSDARFPVWAGVHGLPWTGSD